MHQDDRNSNEQARNDSQAADTIERLQPRMPVFSNDGVHLGHVHRIDSENKQFMLSAPGKYDYWLDFSQVDSVRTGYVLLRITRSEAAYLGRASGDRSLPYISPARPAQS